MHLITALITALRNFTHCTIAPPTLIGPWWSSTGQKKVADSEEGVHNLWGTPCLLLPCENITLAK